MHIYIYVQNSDRGEKNGERILSYGELIAIFEIAFRKEYPLFNTLNEVYTNY